MIKYIGSKRLLLPHITAAVDAIGGVRTVADLFSGTSRVGHALKKHGYYVLANDHLSYAHTLAQCYVEADRDVVASDADRLIRDLQKTKPRNGYFTKTFCEQARFFQPKNGRKVDGIRSRVAKMDLDPTLEAIALTSLMEAADRVDSTTGVQMAYLKKWAPRSYNDLELRVPEIVSGSGVATKLDALSAAHSTEADVVYIDPPYNQHSYMGNYHVWETLIRWDRPQPYGVARKRIGCRSYSSDFNSKRKIHQALADVVDAISSRHLIVSFNSEGHITREDMESLLSRKGYVGVAAVDFKRYVGAQIGIHNPKGAKVGTVSHLRNKEYLYVVSDCRKRVNQAVRAIDASVRTDT